MKRKQHKFIICFAIAGISTASLLAPLSTQGASILVNGDFESPTLQPVNSYSAYQLPTGWSGSTLGIFNVGPSGWTPRSASYPAPQSGNQYVDLGSGAGYSLSQAFTISSAGNYDLTWYDNTAVIQGGTPNSLYSVEVVDASQNTVAAGVFNAQHQGTWTLESLDFNLAAGNYTLEFLSQPTDIGTLLDNVSLVDPPAVPETTSTLGLTAIALWGLGMLKRKLA
jgi:hypothetical protein